MAKDSLTITDNRTGRTYEVPVEHDTINAMDLRQIKVNENDFGMLSYDPGFKNTASTKSTITYIDGGKASCATGATPSISWPKIAPIWKWPISY